MADLIVTPSEIPLLKKALERLIQETQDEIAVYRPEGEDDSPDHLCVLLDDLIVLYDRMFLTDLSQQRKLYGKKFLTL